MNTASFSYFRKNMKSYLTRVSDDQEPLLLSGPHDEAVVVIPLSTYNSFEETNHLLSSPANARQLRESIAELRTGKGTAHKLIEE